MSKRDYIGEIAAKRSRLPSVAGRWQQLSDRLDDLLRIGRFLDARQDHELEFRSELAKYLPIGHVACIEGYFRLVYRDLIDYGSPYRDNAVGFKELKLSVDHVVAMQGGHLTLGEFVSHLLPTSSFDDIASNMSTLLGESFLDRLKTVQVSIDDNSPEFTLASANLHGKVFAGVGRLFELRHICAHELTVRHQVSVSEVTLLSRGALLFLWTTETMVSAACHD